jgi:hypothetical protein
MRLAKSEIFRKIFPPKDRWKLEQMLPRRKINIKDGWITSVVDPNEVQTSDEQNVRQLYCVQLTYSSMSVRRLSSSLVNHNAFVLFLRQRIFLQASCINLKLPNYAVYAPSDKHISAGRQVTAAWTSYSRDFRTSGWLMPRLQRYD